MSISNACPETAYLTKDNIVVDAYLDADTVAAMEDRARSEMAIRRSVDSVVGGTIDQSNQ